MCLDTFGRKAGEKVGMADCHGLGGNQVCHVCVVYSYCFSLSVNATVDRLLASAVSSFH